MWIIPVSYTHLDVYKRQLLNDWKIEHISGLNEQAQKAQEYLMKLPGRLQKITDRIATPDLQYQFKWVKT